MKEEVQSDFEILQKKHSFKIEDHPEKKKIKYLNFEDGRRYKLQLPSFMEMHELIHDSESPMTSLFLRGLRGLFSENEKSVKIDEDYCESNKTEGLMWSEILRGLLSGYFIGE
ncbi:MAG: hypothetical protein KAS32_18445 [Candidatus Peribacteraceae bacterium]|nr:hypothetical protein [Candidatus Peribacteraceae bacterium]